MLVLLVGISRPRRRYSIINDGPYFRRRTVSATIGRHRAGSVVVTSWRRCNASGRGTVVRIRDSIRCLLLRLRWCWLRQSLRSWIAGCNVVHLGRRRWTSHWSMTMRFLVLSHRLWAGTWLPRWWWRRSNCITLIIWIGRLWLRVLDLSQTSTPIGCRTGWCRAGALGSWRTRAWNAPLRSRRSSHARCLILLWMDVLRHWSAVLIRHSGRLPIVTKKLQSCLDMDVHWIEVSGALISVQCVRCLVIA